MSSTRTAFELYPALVARNALISCVAVSHGADRLYLGLQDGQLEEHRIGTAPGGSVQVALGARKHVSRKVTILGTCWQHSMRICCTWP